MLEHLGDHIPADAEMPGCLALSVLIDHYIAANVSIEFHAVHLPAWTQADCLERAIWDATPP